jgi:hypothetical protein
VIHLLHQLGQLHGETWRIAVMETTTKMYLHHQDGVVSCPETGTNSAAPTTT